MTLALNYLMALEPSAVEWLQVSTVVWVVIAIVCSVVGRLWLASQILRIEANPQPSTS